MFRNYFKTAYRNLIKNKIFSGINIFGLTIGLTSCILITLYIEHELTYDDFEQKGSRIARVIMEYSFGGSSESQKGNYTSVRVAPVFRKNFPEVESAIIMTEYPRVVKYNNKLFDEPGFMYSDSTFFDLFSFKLLQGNPLSLLNGPYRVVLTQSTAKKYFGNQDPLGKTIQVGNDSNFYRITGIVQDCPSNSQIKFDFLASFSSLGITHDYEESYWDANYTTFLLLKDKSSIESLQKKIFPFMKKEMEGKGATINFYLEPFDKIHLHSPYAGFEPNNSITYVYILAAVALLTLVIACSTYINLSTARSIERAKEVGIRKVIGAEKKQLFWQFIGESFLLCILALTLSLIAASLLMPFFSELTEKQLQIRTLFTVPFILFSLGIASIVSLLAGGYPALILSGFQPVKVLKGSFANTGSGQWLRKSLTIFQFVISVFLIISTTVVQKQLYYIQHKELGYDREHVLVLPMDNKMLDNLSLIKQEFKSDPDIISVSRCVRTPVEGGGGYNMRSAQMSQDMQIAITANPVDQDYIKTTGLQIIAGEGLTEQDIKDASSDDPKKRLYHFVLNESAARQLGWSPEEAVGKKMFMGEDRQGFVRGIVKDFHFESLHQAIRPFVLFPEYRGRKLLVKINGRNLPQTISFLESKWKELVPQRPFEYQFMDENYNKLYSAEIRLGKVMSLFASIAIVLACLGLFGLSSYTVQQRVKEIAVRKILGAPVASITAMLSKGFLKLVLISMVIAIPVSWWAVNSWLDNFAYRTSISCWVFVVCGFASLLIALITVSFQAIRAAIARPVKSLRIE